ncbi:putative acyl-coa dehydrogenase FADE36 [Patulibacter medicamentivorans]|uniref:Putative acyl-coa dehydrogenase FADE36 n=1 Tax=Patulibacter medicamentivorans TaxID=1097667 RepID=H0EB98_9ACTN|nr:phosphotransferase family protein [Patulibacter medicamentivorans]EHN09062.1 putative acyl-coa dehydrogenase FADE36 [Patulibacter medicamentivorans]
MSGGRPASAASGPIDAAREVRAEDAFDPAPLHDWLAERVDGLGDAPPEVRQFSGGASNLTYLLRYPARELIVRRPPAGEHRGAAHDVLREARIQRRLKPVYRHVPEVVAIGEDEAAQAALGGRPFYVMERLEGTIVRGRLPSGMALSAADARRLGEAAIDTLVELHAVDVERAGLGDLGRGAGYVERQVTGWAERYRAARTPRSPRFERVISWLREHQPDDVAIRVIHNDFRLDNLVLDPADPGHVIGVLDWEMATLGDPLMDLGSALAYWVQADDGRGMRLLKRQPTDLPGMLTRDEVVAHYCRRAGIERPDWTFYEVFGLFRLAAILQQIYHRYHAGQTTNEAFKRFWLAVRYLDLRCRRIIRQAG